VNEPKSKGKPFAIPKQAVVEAFRKVKANQGGLFAADLSNGANGAVGSFGSYGILA
jgi:hypothetical protein